MIEFVTGRGRKVHMRSRRRTRATACGCPFDVTVEKRFVDRDEFCSNCAHTHEYKSLSAREQVPGAVQEPPQGATGLAPTVTGGV